MIENIQTKLRETWPLNSEFGQQTLQRREMIHDAAAKLDRLERQRDELMAALEIITAQLERVGDNRYHKDGQFIEEARAAIAKVREG